MYPCKPFRALAVAAILSGVTLSGQAWGSATATTRFTAVTPAANPGGVLYQNVLFSDELVSVGGGYPKLLDPSISDSTTYHSTAGGGSGLAFFADSWTSSLGSAAITLNESQNPFQGLLFANLTDQLAIDGLVDSVAIRNSTTSSANWLIETSGHTATNTLYLKLHGVLGSAPGADRWVMASGKGAYANNGSALGNVTYPFEWLLGFDGGAPGSRADFFTFTMPSNWSVSLNNFALGVNDFSLDFQAGVSFSAPDDKTAMSLETTFSCAVYNATCAADTIEIQDPIPPISSVPAPLPLAGALLAWRSSRRLRARSAQAMNFRSSA